jgi:hypothetical protein
LESGPDVNTYPGLLLPAVGKHAEQIVTLRDVPRRRATDTLFAKVAGLDVPLKAIQVAVRCRQESGKLLTQARSFGTMTRDLRALADSPQALGVTHVALEATGVLGKPAWNIREGRFTLLLVNPRHLQCWLRRALAGATPAGYARSFSSLPG